MRQLVQLNESAERFEEMGVEVIAVFREEKMGVAGLQKIKTRTETPFTLCLDLGAENTPRYSSGKKEFDNYVIDSTGNIVAMIDGTLKDRATSEELLEVLEGLTEDAAEEAEAEQEEGEHQQEEKGHPAEMGHGG